MKLGQRIRRSSCMFYLFVVVATQQSYADDEFRWLPVTDKDWEVVQDTAKGIRDAVVIFEHVIADDRKMRKKKYFLEMYRRMKVFTSEGRKWAEVSLQYLDDAEEIEEIQARAILPGGQEIHLTKDAIHESEVLKTEGVKVKQKSFSIPGVTDGAIIEYRYRQRRSNPNNIWLFQKTIPLLRGEYQWYFVTDVGSSSLLFLYRLIGIKPHYLWLNCPTPGTLEKLPSETDMEQLRFTITDVPAFVHEPHAMADGAILMQLQCYYGNPKTAGEFWGDMADLMTMRVDYFLEEKDELSKVAARFSNLPTSEEKVDSAYQWVQTNIKNISLEAEQDQFEYNKNVDDVLERRYATPEEINILFYGLLDKLDISVRMIYAVNHNKKKLEQQAKYWQFDKSIVYVALSPSKAFYCSPGDAYMPKGLVPWFVEGTAGLTSGIGLHPFNIIPPSQPEANRHTRVFNLQVGEEMKLSGHMVDSLLGHNARSLRLRLANTPEDTWVGTVTKELENTLPGAQIDSVRLQGVESVCDPLITFANVTFPPLERMAANRLILRPFSIIDRPENPFTAERRKYPVVMEYAEIVLDRVNIELPKNVKIESTPSRSGLNNTIGRAYVSPSISDRTISVDRVFNLKQAFWPETHYGAVRSLFQQYEDLTDFSIVLTENPK